ncbi:hypothetical protein Tco_1196414 [Tanacetum coccineum]
MGDTNPISTLGDYSKPSHEGYRNTIELPAGNNVLPLRCDTIRNYKTPQRYPDIPTTSSRISLRSMDSRTIDQSAGGKLRDRNAKESWALLKDLSLHENESWNDQRNFVKSVKVISLPQDVPITSNRRLIELKNQVQRLMEAHLAPTQPTQVNKITTSCEICSGPHDTQYCMEDLEQAFVKYASSRTDEAGDSLSTLDNEVGVTSPKSTTQTLPLFEEYTPLVTFSKEVEKTLGTPIEVEPLNEAKLEEVGLKCNLDTPFSSREVPTFDGPEPQPLLTSPSLNVSLGDVTGPEPPIKPHSPDSSRMKMFDDDWGLESKEVSPLGEELSLFDRPNEVERVLSSVLTYKIACTKFLIKNKEEIFTDAGDGIRIYPDGVAPPAM